MTSQFANYIPIQSLPKRKVGGVKPTESMSASVVVLVT